MSRAGGWTRGFVVAGALLATTASPAGATAAGGATTLELSGPAAAKLRAAGVAIRPLGASSGGPRRAVLPATAGLAGSSTTLVRLRGGLELRHGRRHRLRLDGLTILIGRRSRVTARAGVRRVELFRILPGGARRVEPDSGDVALSHLRLALTGSAARLLVRRLGVALSPRSLRGELFGRLWARISGIVPGGSPAAGGKTQGGAETVVDSGQCPLPGGPGPEPENPLPVAARPPAAVDVTAATLDWRARESFVQYIGTGEGTSVSDGATADPPERLPGSSAALSYTFHFPFASGWLDTGANPADPGDDTATIAFGGAVRFLYSAHEIDLTTATPEIEIAGARSRAIFTISDGAAAGERQVLVNLDLGRAAKIEHNGDTYTYERVPGAIPSGTASTTFAGFYAPGTAFGCFDVSYATAS